MPGAAGIAGLGSGLSEASAGLGAIEGAAQFIKSIHDEKQAKRELAVLNKPFYKIQDEYFQNNNIAGNLAEDGLTSSEKNAYNTNSERGLSAGIGATLQGGGSASDIAKLSGIYTNAQSNEAAADSAAHIENIKYFMGTNKELAGQKTTQWALNEYQPYEQKLKELTERQAAAKQNQANGADETIGSIGALGTDLSNQDLYNKLFGNKKNKIEQLPSLNFSPSTISSATPFNPGLSNKVQPAGLFEKSAPEDIDAEYYFHGTHI